MARVSRGVRARARHKKIIAQAKGYRGRRKNVFRVANQAVARAAQYAYRDRKVRKRQFRRLWILRLNGAARNAGLTYATLMHGLKKAQIGLDRKLLANMATDQPQLFNRLVERAKQALEKK